MAASAALSDDAPELAEVAAGVATANDLLGPSASASPNHE
jgi:hypothetical protein